MATIDDIYESSERFFDDWERILRKLIVRFLTGNLSVVDNAVEATTANWIVLSRIDSIGNFEKAKDYIKKNIAKIISEEVERYNAYGGDALKSETIKSFLDRFDQLDRDNDVSSKYFTSVRNNLLTRIIEGATLQQVKDYVDSTNVGYKNFAEQTYTLYQRTSANSLRKRVGLKYAVYEGGLIRNSRDFCRERDGKVFSEEEITGWGSLDWPEKPPGYNPFTDLGGYNCRHRLNWISEELAEFLRRNG